MSVTGDPAELRKLAQEAKAAAADIESIAQRLDKRYQATHFAVANKHQVDEIVRAASAQSRAMSTNLRQLQSSLQKIAAALEQVGR
ncbi:hypothetical protein EEB13_10140 [Rhodococcus sp. WS3]|uniref:hypothetical protein n=1 Tax=Rhodococcus sp. WS3 TaxID=2486271 RepID=UPI001142BA31|nr:hypothetical protein [Rhodococcus sp. WS3]ROZ50166.1 hypothetical protein EEB13_10140 [Rhodococcus sp. WS3]